MDAHLRDLRYFVAVAEELNFTRAAERLHLSQPALSKQIRGLETALRAQLFRRDRRQVELTGAGAALHGVARSLLQDRDDGVAVVGDAAAQDARVLRVGTLTSIGREPYPAITGQFAKRQPAGRWNCTPMVWRSASGWQALIATNILRDRQRAGRRAARLGGLTARFLAGRRRAGGPAAAGGRRGELHRREI